MLASIRFGRGIYVRKYRATLSRLRIHLGALAEGPARHYFHDVLGRASKVPREIHGDAVADLTNAWDTAPGHASRHRAGGTGSINDAAQCGNPIGRGNRERISVNHRGPGHIGILAGTYRLPPASRSNRV